MWSGPRTVSTALMRSWENRPDTVVVDEPLYAFYLDRTGLDHPGREQVIASQPTSWRTVIRQLTDGPLPPGRPVCYAKHMTHHLLPEVDRDALAPLRHAFLIRDPAELLASYARVRATPTLDDLGLWQQAEIFDRFGGPVIDSHDLLDHPEAVLRALCAALGVPFSAHMLHWPACPRDTDGVWAPYWYESVWRSTGFGRYRPPDQALPAALAALAEQCQPYYDRLHAHRLTGNRQPDPGGVMLQQFDERNRDLIVNVGGKLAHRDEAGVSPFDSAVQGGDAVWEGLRLYQGRIFRLTEHLARLRQSAAALAFTGLPTGEEITEQIRRTLQANRMTDEVHIRLTLTRGVKITSGMDPRLNQSGPTLIVLAEHKAPVYDQSGLALITSSVRRPAPDTLDPKIHHNNLLSSILAKIEANVAGADDAVMLDSRGFVAETNATHLFLVTAGQLGTPSTVACPEGITRAAVLDIAADAGIPCRVGDYSLTQFYAADEVFVTGTMGGLAAVTSLDGRVIGSGAPGPVTGQLTGLYAELTARSGTKLI